MALLDENTSQGKCKNSKWKTRHFGGEVARPAFGHARLRTFNVKNSELETNARHDLVLARIRTLHRDIAEAVTYIDGQV